MERRVFLREDLVRLDEAITAAKTAHNRAKAEVTRSFGEQNSGGDNPAYEAARREEEMCASHLNRLTAIRKGATVFSPNGDGDHVAVGKRVTVEDASSGAVEIYSIGSFWVPDDSTDGVRISYASPIAKAIMLARAGDVREVIVGVETRKLKVITIE